MVGGIEGSGGTGESPPGGGLPAGGLPVDGLLGDGLLAGVRRVLARAGPAEAVGPAAEAPGLVSSAEPLGVTAEAGVFAAGDASMPSTRRRI
jgi:hypothetical protein